jgi:5'-3' exonuclease
MGIHGYTKHLLTNFPNIVSGDCPDNVDTLYIDFNGMIHSCISTETTTKTLLKEVSSKLEALVKLVNPTKIYIAIDGVCPLAKAKQQRNRRYKSLGTNKEVFDRCCITPGTKFMTMLSKELSKTTSKKLFHDKTVVISDSSFIGEGEHKILKDIRSRNQDNSVNIIHGLDADLIMLSLSTHRKNLFLMRELEDKTQYISIDKVYEAIASEQKYPKRFINDYIFICFLGGNDFVPNLPSIEIRLNGITDLVKYHSKFNKFIVNDDETQTINYTNLKQFFQFISEYEYKTLLYYQKRYSKDIPAKYITDEMVYPFEDPVMYNKPEWTRRYYETMFHQPKVQTRDICHNYIEMLVWNYKYYIGQPVDWMKCYKYERAPLLKDLCRFFKTPGEMSTNSRALKPFELLMLVLPPDSADLLPKRIGKLMTTKLAEYYPLEYGIDKAHCYYHHQCKVMYPPLDVEYICSVMQPYVLKCTEKEQLRNLSNH